MKENKNLLQELRDKEELKKEKINQVVAATNDLLRRKEIIHKASQVKHLIAKKHDLEVKDHFIIKVFHERIGLKYKRVKRIAFRGNDEKNLVLRQKFAMRLLELMDSGKRIINVDESWLSDTQFIRSKWNLKG